MGKADLHLHSTHSDGFEPIGHILAYVDQHTDLDVIAITDHDCLDGALLARDLVAQGRYRVQIIVGAEISTREGHLLALDIERLIPAGLSMAETIQAVREQGGLAIVAHPLSRWCDSANIETLIALERDPRTTPDGLEGINGSFAGIGSNARALRLNRTRFGWAETGGSDAHTLNAIGSSYTVFPGRNADALCAALRARATQAFGGYWPMRSFLSYSLHTAWHWMPSGLRVQPGAESVS